MVRGTDDSAIFFSAVFQVFGTRARPLVAGDVDEPEGKGLFVGHGSMYETFYSDVVLNRNLVMRASVGKIIVAQGSEETLQLRRGETNLPQGRRWYAFVLADVGGSVSADVVLFHTLAKRGRCLLLAAASTLSNVAAISSSFETKAAMTVARWNRTLQVLPYLYPALPPYSPCPLARIQWRNSQNRVSQFAISCSNLGDAHPFAQ